MQKFNGCTVSDDAVYYVKVILQYHKLQEAPIYNSTYLRFQCVSISNQ